MAISFHHLLHILVYRVASNSIDCLLCLKMTVLELGFGLPETLHHQGQQFAYSGKYMNINVSDWTKCRLAPHPTLRIRAG